MRAGGVAGVAEHLPSKCEALNSNPSIANKYINIFKIMIVASYQIKCMMGE
jgi:hypothetical protein